jgi:hypothetical protein
MGEIGNRVAPKLIFLCEGALSGQQRKDFDADIYNTIFSSKCDAGLFISGGGCEDLVKSEHSGYAILSHLLKHVTIKKVLDRDDRSDNEVNQLKTAGILVLKRRNLESYLFDDEILIKLAQQKGASEELQKQILQMKSDAVTSSVKRNNARDDIKSASGEIYVGLKKMLDLTRCGNKVDAFMRDTLSKLITEETKVYKELESELFNPE